MNILELGALLLAGVFFIIIYYMDKVKKFDFSILTILGLVFGIIVGIVFKGYYRYLEAIGNIYSNLILATVIPLLFFSIISSITDLDSSIRLKKIGAKTIFFLLLNTFLAAVITLILAVVSNVGSGINYQLANNLKLYDKYESRNEEGKVEQYNLITRVYVQMPYINIIKKQKELKEFSELEKGIYIFENGLTDDIMALKGHKVIEVMKNKIDKFNKDEELRDMAYKRSLNRWANEQDKQDMYEKGKEKGIIEKNREKTKQLFKKYYPDENPDILDNLNNEQYDKIFEMILDNCC